MSGRVNSYIVIVPRRTWGHSRAKSPPEWNRLACDASTDATQSAGASHKKSIRPLRIGARVPIPGTYRLLNLMPEIPLDKGDILGLPPRESLRYVLIDSTH